MVGEGRSRGFGNKEAKKISKRSRTWLTLRAKWVMGGGFTSKGEHDTKAKRRRI